MGSSHLLFMHRGGCWDTVSKWATFKASIVKAAAQSCGQEVTANCRGSSLRTHSCKPVVKEAVKQKEEPWLLVSDPVCDIPPAESENTARVRSILGLGTSEFSLLFADVMFLLASSSLSMDPLSSLSDQHVHLTVYEQMH